MDIKWIKKITFKQIGSNCGIYALAFTINLHLAKNNKEILSKKTMRSLIGELTKEAVDSNYSIVGEFFDLTKYREFIKSPEAQKIIEKYVPGLKIEADLVDRQDHVTLSHNEGLILAYARPKNTHIVPVIEIDQQKVKYINDQKLCTKKLSDREQTKFKVHSNRIKRLFTRPIFIIDTYLAMLGIVGLMSLLLISNEWFFSLFHANWFVMSYFVLSVSVALGYCLIFVLLNVFKIARFEEMRIELRNNKYLKDIPIIELDKLVKVTFSS